MGTFRGVGDPTADGIRVASQDDLDAAVNAADQFAQDADASATASATSAQESEAALYEFDGIWLQSQASDPTTDLNGDPLTGNELYHNTVANDIRYYNLGDTTWYTFGVIGPGSSVDGGIPEWDGTGGNTLRDSGKTLATLIDEVGDVDGPVSASDGNLAVFDGTTGKLIKDGGPLGGGTGDVVGPSFSTANDIVTFDGTSGKLIKDSGTKLGDLGDVQGPGSSTIGNLATWADTFGLELADGGPPSSGGGATKNYARNPMITAHQKGTDKTNMGTKETYVDGFEYFDDMTQFRVRQQVLSSNLPTDPDDIDVTQTLRTTITTAESALGADEKAGIAMHIEAQDMKDWLWGTPNAKDVTISFLAQQNLDLGGTEATLAFAVQNAGLTQSWVTDYTLDQFVWTKVEITIPGPTDISFSNAADNGIGASFMWMIQGGTDATTPGTWEGADRTNTAAADDFYNQTGMYLEITKIKIEVGSAATDFTMETEAAEWERNLRYYQTSRTRNEDIATNSQVGQEYDYATNLGNYRKRLQWYTVMRKPPTVTARDPVVGTANSVRYNNSTRTPFNATQINEFGCNYSYSSATANAPVEFHWDADANMTTGH